MRIPVIRIVLIAGVSLASAADAGTSDAIRRGQAIFRSRCALCHDDSLHMLNDVGPALFGVVNRPVGSVEGYRYSPALKTAGARGDRWTPARLNRLLIEPTQVYMGTSMPAAIDDPRDRKAMLAYLKSLRPTD